MVAAEKMGEEVPPDTIIAAAPRAVRRLEDLPGPRAIPVLGNALQVSVPKLHLQLEQWAAHYGTPYTFRLGPQRVLVIGDPGLAAKVMRARPETFRRLSPLAPVLRELGMDGVFSAEGEAWRHQRRLSMQALAHRHLRGFFPTLRTMVERLRLRFAAAAAGGRELLLRDEFSRFTVDVTTALVFGHDAKTLSSDEDIIQRRISTMFDKLAERVFAPIPYWRLVRLPSDRRSDRVRDELAAWMQGLIDKTRERLTAQSEIEPTNMIEAMLIARDEADKAYSDPLISANALTMLLAGEDTTASTMAWAVHELCDNPVPAARLRDEAERVLGDSLVPEDIEISAALTYATAVAHETMRLRPAAPIMMVDANEDTEVGDVLVPAGASVAMLPRQLTGDAKRFSEPAAFLPERWLDEHAVEAHDPSAHIPFGSGPRICPGRTLALVEIRSVLGMLYRNFTVERVGAREAVSERYAFTMAPENLRIRLHEKKALAPKKP